MIETQRTLREGEIEVQMIVRTHDGHRYGEDISVAVTAGAGVGLDPADYADSVLQPASYACAMKVAEAMA